MGRYGLTKVLTTVLRVDLYPMPVVLETYDFVDCRNGTVLKCGVNDLIIVSHYNGEGFGPDYFHRTIHAVPVDIWTPEENPGKGPDAIIGRYQKPDEIGRVDPWPVKRDGYSNGDSAIEAALRSENRWPDDVPGVWKQ